MLIKPIELKEGASLPGLLLLSLSGGTYHKPQVGEKEAGKRGMHQVVWSTLTSLLSQNLLTCCGAADDQAQLACHVVFLELTIPAIETHPWQPPARHDITTKTRSSRTHTHLFTLAPSLPHPPAHSKNHSRPSSATVLNAGTRGQLYPGELETQGEKAKRVLAPPFRAGGT